MGERLAEPRRAGSFLMTSCKKKVAQIKWGQNLEPDKQRLQKNYKMGRVKIHFK